MVPLDHVFYFGTGFHGLTTIICVAPFINIHKLKTTTLKNNSTHAQEINNNNSHAQEINNNNSLLVNMPSFRDKESESYFFARELLENFISSSLLVPEEVNVYVYICK